MREPFSRRKCLKCAGALLCAPLASLLGGCRAQQGAQAGDAAPEHHEKSDYAAGYEPDYVALHRSGELRERGRQLWDMMRRCRLCPRQCGVDRIAGNTGICRATAQLRIASHQAHFGEERPLVGRGGSGTVFFSHCSLRCVFCINWQVSHGGEGSYRSIDELADMMLALQERGCANINVVTPTHYVPHILLALDVAAAKGLRLPLVYNTCGWEQQEVLQLLDGVVDIYLPDFKYGCADAADRYSPGARDYPDVTRAAFLEMHRQVGVARVARDGLVYRGLMIRHLVMPNRAADTRTVLEWIAEKLPKDSYINIMSQYTPYYQAREFPEISRRITREEYAEALAWARDAGLSAIDAQGFR